MNHMIDPALSEAHAPFFWYPATDPKHDARDVLAEALGPMWSVHFEADCEGEVSIVVLPDDGDIGPAFLLYENGGLIWVGTVSGDEWTSRESFSGIQAAVTAIIVKTGSVAMAKPTGASTELPT